MATTRPPPIGCLAVPARAAPQIAWPL